MKNISKQIFQYISDEVLIQQFKEGSPEAFDVLYQRYLLGVFRRVRYVIPENDMQDVTQEIFIEVSKSLLLSVTIRNLERGFAP